MKEVENHIYYNLLFDIYGDLLNDREKEIFTLSVVEDLSLQEIADIKGVSKTAIGTALSTIHKKLDHYEETLHFYEKEQALLKLAEEIKEEKIKEKIQQILK